LAFIVIESLWNVRKALERAVERSKNVYDKCGKQHDCNGPKI